MKYKTSRQSNIIISFIFLLFCICISSIVLLYMNEGRISDYVFSLCVFAIGITYFVWAISYDAKRKVCMQNGTCFSGNIIGAERIFGGKSTNKYYLKILFHDEKDMIRYTEAYVGNPNNILKDCNCHIYKWKGHYIEADFNTCKNEEKTNEEIVPIDVIPSYPFGKVGKVTSR